MTELWVLVGAQIVGFVVWIVRLEMRLRFLQESYDVYKLLSDKQELSTVTRLDKIETFLAEISTDLKWIIKNVNGGLRNAAATNN